MSLLTHGVGRADGEWSWSEQMNAYTLPMDVDMLSGVWGWCVSH
jgi:hypothetical protein